MELPGELLVVPFQQLPEPGDVDLQVLEERIQGEVDQSIVKAAHLEKTFFSFASRRRGLDYS